MKSFSETVKLNKPGIGLVVLALTIGGISAKAAGEINTRSGGYLMCVKHNTNEVTYPASTTCPKGYTKLVLGGVGEDGATGATGPAGTNGTNGVDGAVGAKGDTGATGPKGDTGTPGVNALATQYAVGHVLVSRGNGAPARWASYSTSLGSPYGNTASGTFRFTCSLANAPCIVSLEAQTTSTGVNVYPRVMIYKSSIDSGQIFGQCEYADGSPPFPAGFTPVGQTATPLIVNIGGSLDCGWAGQTRPSDGNVSSIMVPAGYYDVQSNFTFK